MGIFVTSDTHFGHIFVASLRGFDNVAEHDAFLQDRWNSVVSPSDTVYHLGDLTASVRDLDALSRIHLNGRLILVAGNHDGCWHRHHRPRDVREAIGRVPDYVRAGVGVIFTSGAVALNPDGRGKVLFSHLPVEGDHTESDRYSDARPGHGEMPVLCGHVHDSWRTRPGWRQLNVGVDVNGFTPIPLSVALREVRALPGVGASGASVEGPWNDMGLA